MKDGLVSIIMPMYNSAKYVGEAIDSVLSQTYTFWELLVVDDGSTDDSVQIVKRYCQQDSRIRLLFNTNHIQQPSAPRNAGLCEAQGQFIAFLDSDDCWLPAKLNEQLKLFADHGVAAVYSNYEKMAEDGKRSNRVVRAPESVSYDQLLYGNVIGNLTGIYDRNKVGTVNILDIHHEDYAMWLAILAKGFIARNTNTVTALYRLRPSSITSNKLKVLSWQWNIYRQVEHIGFFKSCYYYLHYAVRAYIKNNI
ncbi:MAG: glycosyltransferase [Prevotella sp.]|nr:glycosyltransferase [Prevotella sp.]